MNRTQASRDLERQIAVLHNGALYTADNRAVRNARCETLAGLYWIAQEWGIRTIYGLAPLYRGEARTELAEWWAVAQNAPRSLAICPPELTIPATVAFKLGTPPARELIFVDLSRELRWPLCRASSPRELIEAVCAIERALLVPLAFSPGTTALNLIEHTNAAHPEWLDDPAPSPAPAPIPPLRYCRALPANLAEGRRAGYFHLFDMNAAYVAAAQGIKLNGHYLLRHWADRLWAARRACQGIGSQLGVSTVKAIYTQGYGRLRTYGSGERPLRWYRPHWHNAIAAELRRRVEWRANVLTQQGTPPILANIDALGFVSVERDPDRAVPTITERRYEIGGYKHVLTVPIGAIRAELDAGNVVRVLREARRYNGRCDDGASN